MAQMAPHQPDILSHVAEDNNLSQASLCPPKTSLKSPPLRTCIATREEHPKSNLIRFVIGPDQTIFADIHQKLPGRGFYVSPLKDHLQKAVKHNLFAKTAKTSLNIPNDLLSNLITSKANQILNILHLAKRSGALIIGADHILAYLKNSPVQIYIVLAGSDNSAYRHIAPRINVENIITPADLTPQILQSLKIPNTGHLALKQGAQAEQFLHQYQIYTQII